jgi:hypothetical protein
MDWLTKWLFAETGAPRREAPSSDRFVKRQKCPLLLPSAPGAKDQTIWQ